jgi:hypothetical protein
MSLIQILLIALGSKMAGDGEKCEWNLYFHSLKSAGHSSASDTYLGIYM